MINNKLVHGIGMNDLDYDVVVFESNEQARMCGRKSRRIVWKCPYYTAWYNMLARTAHRTNNHPYSTYEGVVVCEEWKTASLFKEWMETQDWKGKQLDKDLLVQGNKVYSPNTCVFVDGVVNTFLNDRAASRGEWPLGVCWKEKNGKFQCQCNNPFTKKSEYLGLFTCPQEAHKAWKKRKHELACQLAEIQTDERVADALRVRFLP